jgi:nicotinamidase-related amidase
VKFLDNPAIILVDMLNDFVTGALEVKRAKAIIPPLQRLVTAARKNDVPVIYSKIMMVDEIIREIVR